jgi:hypothetical protein
MIVKNKVANYTLGIIALVAVLVGSIGFAIRESRIENAPTLPVAQVLVNGTNPSAMPMPVDLTGVWVQTDGTSHEGMTAEIGHGQIVIALQLGARTGTYWDGSFDYDQIRPDTTSFTVVSQSSHPVSPFASKLSTKSFTYKDGVLSYDFTIVGTERTIKMRKGGA